MKTDVYSIKYPFEIDASLGRLAVETDFGAHVDQLLRQLLLTDPGERINRPDFGCGIRRMLFAPNSEANASLLQVTVYQAIQKWLSSVVHVGEVKVSTRDEVLEVRVVYALKATQERRYLNLEVTI